MLNFPPNIMRYGSTAALPARQTLRAGPLTLELEQGDLRIIRVGEREILRRLYVAVRDRNWGTVAPQFSNWAFEIKPDTFRVTFDARHVQDDIDFSWKGEITGDETGTLRYLMDGVARSTFFRNRIGFCVLYPRECAGTKARIEHDNAEIEDAQFPELVDPHQPVKPFSEMRALAHPIDQNTWARIEMQGETFEMEDQRNWTDASFKIFGTPLRLPFPVEVVEGTRISQSFTLTLEPPPVALQTTPASDTVQLSIGTPAFVLPSIGLGAASHADPLTAREIQMLDALHLDHMRVDLYLADHNYTAVLQRAAADAAALNVPLWVALFLDDEPTAQLQTLRQALNAVAPRVAMWLIYPAQECYNGGAPLSHLVARARELLGAYDSTARFATGSNADYIFFARNVPSVWNADAVTIALNPQVHAFDNASLMETLQAQEDVIDGARAAAPALPIIVSPITLKPRRNFYTTGAEIPTPPHELPRPVDVRQMSLFGAVWTALSIKHVAQAGAGAVTYFETTGWRGVMEAEKEPALPEIFFSHAGMVFPLYHVFADVAERRTGTVVACESAQPLRIQGLALREGTQVRLLVCNLTETAQTAQIHGVAARHVSVRHLNETSFAQATMKPQEFRSRVSERANMTAGTLQITLMPYETARIDWTEGS